MFLLVYPVGRMLLTLLQQDTSTFQWTNFQPLLLSAPQSNQSNSNIEIGRKTLWAVFQYLEHLSKSS